MPERDVWLREVPENNINVDVVDAGRVAVAKRDSCSSADTTSRLVVIASDVADEDEVARGDISSMERSAVRAAQDAADLVQGMKLALDAFTNWRASARRCRRRARDM